VITHLKCPQEIETWNSGWSRVAAKQGANWVLGGVKYSVTSIENVTRKAAKVLKQGRDDSTMTIIWRGCVYTAVHPYIVSIC